MQSSSLLEQGIFVSGIKTSNCPFVVRICGGAARGIPLQIPKGIEIRPATEANRERLFSSLGERVVGTHFLDLFAGTGSYGLEALSRGAKQGEFVENHRKAIGSLNKNLENVCKSAQSNQNCFTVHKRDVIEYLKSNIAPFDLIFLDPPYPIFPQVGPIIFELILENKMIKGNGLLIHEAPPETRSDFDGWEVVRTIGKSKKGCPSFKLFQIKT